MLMGTCLDKTHSCIWTIDANCDYKYNQTTSHLSQSVRGEVGYGYRTFFSLSFLSPLFSLYILYQQSPLPLISCCSPFLF